MKIRLNQCFSFNHNLLQISHWGNPEFSRKFLIKKCFSLNAWIADLALLKRIEGSSLYIAEHRPFSSILYKRKHKITISGLKANAAVSLDEMFKNLRLNILLSTQI